LQAAHVDPGASSGDSYLGPSGAWHSPDRANPRRLAQRPRRPTKLEPFQNYLQQRVKQAHPLWLPSTVLLREIREQGYGASQLRAWLRTLKTVKPDEGRWLGSSRSPASRCRPTSPSSAAASRRCRRSWQRWTTAA